MPGRIKVKLRVPTPRGMEKKLRRFQPGGSMQRAAERVFEAAAAVLHQTAREKVPVAFGRLRDSIRITPFPNGFASSIDFRVTAPYARAVEEGSVPHITVSRRPAEWAALKGVSPRAVYLSIAKRGTRAQPFAAPAVTRARLALLDGLARLPGVARR